MAKKKETNNEEIVQAPEPKKVELKEITSYSYTVVEAKFVEKYLNAGWKIAGGIACRSFGFYQPMIYENKLKVEPSVYEAMMKERAETLRNTIMRT